MGGFCLVVKLHLERSATEFLKVTVSPGNFFLTLSKILRFVCENLKLIHFNFFTVFFFMFYKYYGIFSEILTFFLSQNFKT